MSNLTRLQKLLTPTNFNFSKSWFDTDIVFERLVDDVSKLTHHWSDFNVFNNSLIVNHPTNLTRNGDEYTIEVALAGFSKEDIEILDETHDNRRELVVTGNIKEATTDENTSVISRQISRRNFKKTFSLTENALVGDALFENGLLTIKVTVPSKSEPESQTKKITIQ